MKIELILGITLIIVLLIIIIIAYKNKFQNSLIKINEGDKNIKELLQNKLNLSKKIIPIIKEELKVDDFLIDIDTINKDIDSFSLSATLRDSYNKLLSAIDDNDKLLNNEDIVSLLKELDFNEEKLVACFKYYNDNCSIYNKLIKSFPTNIIKVFFGYKKKESYSFEKRNEYKILSD